MVLFYTIRNRLKPLYIYGSLIVLLLWRVNIFAQYVEKVPRDPITIQEIEKTEKQFFAIRDNKLKEISKGKVKKTLGFGGVINSLASGISLTLAIKKHYILNGVWFSVIYPKNLPTWTNYSGKFMYRCFSDGIQYENGILKHIHPYGFVAFSVFDRTYENDGIKITKYDPPLSTTAFGGGFGVEFISTQSIALFLEMGYAFYANDRIPNTHSTTLGLGINFYVF